MIPLKNIFWILIITLIVAFTINTAMAMPTFDLAGDDLVITNDTILYGHYQNVGSFIVNHGTTVHIAPFVFEHPLYTGELRVDANNIEIYGTINGSGSGGGGGGGGGGGVGNWCSGWIYGPGGLANHAPTPTSTLRGGSLGQNGFDWPGQNWNIGKPNSGGFGGNGFGGVSGGTSHQSNANIRDGQHAPPNSDSTESIFVEIGKGGGGGAGSWGRNTRSSPCGSGEGGQGGGRGGDGGGALTLISNSEIILSGIIDMGTGRSEDPTYCKPSWTKRPGSPSTHWGWNGIAIAFSMNSLEEAINYRCASVDGKTTTLGGSWNVLPSQKGGDGGTGSGGGVILAAPNLNLTGSTVKVDGGIPTNGGTIKLFYTDNVVNGTYEGETAFVYAEFDEDALFVRGRYEFPGNWSNTNFLIDGRTDRGAYPTDNGTLETTYLLQKFVRQGEATWTVSTSEPSWSLSYIIPNECYQLFSIKTRINLDYNGTDTSIVKECFTDSVNTTTLFTNTTSGLVELNDERMVWRMSVDTKLTQPVYMYGDIDERRFNFQLPEVPTERYARNIIIGDTFFDSFSYTGQLQQGVRTAIDDYIENKCIDDGSHRCSIPIRLAAPIGTTGSITSYTITILGREGVAQPTYIDTLDPMSQMELWVRAHYNSSPLGSQYNFVWGAVAND